MNTTSEQRKEPCNMLLLLPAMIAANVFLFVCMAGLGSMALREMANFRGTSHGGDANQQAVNESLAGQVPNHRYRVREWFPATPLAGNAVATTGSTAEPVRQSGFAQRVTLVFYGPSGAKQLDTTYWVQNGKVTRIVPTGGSRFPG